MKIKYYQFISLIFLNQSDFILFFRIKSNEDTLFHVLIDPVLLNTIGITFQNILLLKFFPRS